MIEWNDAGVATIVSGTFVGGGPPPRNYGQAYNTLTDAVVGFQTVNAGALRMDQPPDPFTDGAKRAGWPFTGTQAPAQRYPNLHGTYGDSWAGPVTPRADLVCILTEDLPGNTAGLAQKYTDRSSPPGTTPPVNLIGGTTGVEDVDFNSTEVRSNRDFLRNLSLEGQYISGGYTFMHELGHVLGASHALGDSGSHPHDTGYTFSPYVRYSSNGVGDEFMSVGHHFMAWNDDMNATQEMSGFGGTAAAYGGYCTIMAYPDPSGRGINQYQQIPLFSSPKVFYKGEPTGRLRGMFLPPPLSPYTKPLYFDNARTISTVGHLVAFYRDSNGSGRPTSTSAVRHKPPVGRPASRNPNQANAKGGNSGTAAAGGSNPNRPNTKGGNSGTAAAGGSNPNRPNTKGGNSGTAAAGGGLTQVGGGGLTQVGGGPSTINLAKNPAVPNDHLEHAYKWGLTPDEEGNDPKSGLRVWRFKDSTKTFSTIINGHNNGATREEIKENGLNQRAFHGKSVWWEMEWPEDYPEFIVETLVATTKGSTFDTTLGVMGVPKGADPKDSIHNRSLFFWNNNAVGGGGAFSTVTVPPRAFILKPGHRIFFMVDGVGASSGKIRLDVKFTGSIPPPNP
jgi:hypothetical protein